MAFEQLEISSQRLSPLPDTPHIPEVGFRVPLFDLEADAPWPSPLRYNCDNVKFPLSNDECSAPYFDQLRAREHTPEYQDATHQVAIVVGESALAANLSLIPEKTIIVLDESPDMCVYMQAYVDSLRASRSSRQWREYLVDVGPENIDAFMLLQTAKWDAAGYPHPLKDEEAFKTARAKAKEKVIIPWRADITNRADMSKLGQALRSRDATVTMMNLTNVLPYVGELDTAAQCADLFDMLPLSPNAPILTTSLGELPPRSTFDIVARMQGRREPNVQTGPFFGRDNLAEARQVTDAHPLGTIAQRRYARTEAEAEEMSPEMLVGSLVASLLERMHMERRIATEAPRRPEYRWWVSGEGWY